MLFIFEKAALRRMALSTVNLAAAWAVANVSGRFGVTISQPELVAGIFAGAEYIRHWAAIRYPGLAPWLS